MSDITCNIIGWLVGETLFKRKQDLSCWSHQQQLISMGGVDIHYKKTKKRLIMSSMYNYVSILYTYLKRSRWCHTSDCALRHLLKHASDVASFASLESWFHNEAPLYLKIFFKELPFRGSGVISRLYSFINCWYSVLLKYISQVITYLYVSCSFCDSPGSSLPFFGSTVNSLLSITCI